jgi:hypothetical protein
VDWIHLAQDSVRRALVNTEIKFLFHKRSGFFDQANDQEFLKKALAPRVEVL